jgi:hypothetical protein
VYWDFSAEFVHEPTDFVDAPGDEAEVYDNQPHALTLLSAPFPEALAMIAGREILVLQPPGTFTRHDYRPASAETTGPDFPADLKQVSGLPALGGNPYLLLAAVSWNSGDGLYGIAPDWSLTRLESTNNVRTLVFDAAGAFDNTGAATLYWALDHGLFTYKGADDVLGGALAFECTLLPFLVGIACVVEDQPATSIEVVTVTSTTHEVTSLVGGRWFALAGGEPERLGGLVHGILDSGALVQIAADGGVTTLARTLDLPDWWWVDVVVPPAGHALGSTAAAYVLEVHAVAVAGGGYDLDRFRILRLTPP